MTGSPSRGALCVVALKASRRQQVKAIFGVSAVPEKRLHDMRVAVERAKQDARAEAEHSASLPDQLHPRIQLVVPATEIAQPGNQIDPAAPPHKAAGPDNPLPASPPTRPSRRASDQKKELMSTAAMLAESYSRDQIDQIARIALALLDAADLP